MLATWFAGRSWPIIAAIIGVAFMVTIIGLLIGGLWWLRADAARDARADEQRQCEVARLLANNEAIEAQRVVDNETAAAAARARAEWMRRLDEARGHAAALEVELAKRPPIKNGKEVLFPRAVVREMSR